MTSTSPHAQRSQPPSHDEAGRASADEAVPVNVAAYLPRMARLLPHGRAIVVPAGVDANGRRRYIHATFRQLNEESDRLARGLERVGIKRGVRATLMVKPSLEFFALTFACFKVGVVIVMVDPGMGVRNLKACLDEAEPEAFIGIPKAHAARVILGWGRRTIRTLVTVGGRRLFWGGATYQDLLAAPAGPNRSSDPCTPYPMIEPRPDETAAILFTSGATGVPKGAVYTHGVFAGQVERLRDMFGIAPGEVDLPTFPLFALFDPALGMTAVIPDMDFTRPGSVNPQRILEAVEDHGVTNMFGSPALIDRVGRHGQATGARMPTIRRAFSAGAPVAPATLARFRAMLAPEAEVHTPYGATEALPVAAIESREILNETAVLTNDGKGVCVGATAPGIVVRIIRITDEAIETWSDDLLAPPGEIGEIVARGAIVTESYFNRPAQTRLAKIREVGADGSGAACGAGAILHRMGDVGYLDARGRVWFCGRKAHRVETAAGPMFTIPCEGPFNVHPDVRRSALVGVGERGLQTPVLIVELEPSRAGVDRAALFADLRRIALARPHTASIERFLVHPSFPVDIRHNAKIAREKLAVWAASKLKGLKP